MKNLLNNYYFCRLLNGAIRFACFLFLWLFAALSYLNNLIFLKTYLIFFVLLVPGFIVYCIIHKGEKPFLMKISYSIAYSILFFYLLSLGNIFIFGKFFTGLPLNRNNILSTFSIGYFSLVFVSSVISKKVSTNIKELIPNLRSLHYPTHMMLPIGSILGAVSINNGSSNHITVATYICIFLLFVYYLLFSKKIKDSYIASFFLFASLALLLSYSLRSYHISGYDISQEYKFFLQTANELTWTPSKITDAYQAVLSVTTLPVILLQLTSISTEYVFKLLIVSLFSIIPVILYFTGNIYFSKKITTGGVFFFISQYWYIAQLPTILRQGIAYIFYALLLYTMLDNGNSKLRKNISFILLGTGLIMSHYSTTYIFISIFVILKLILSLLNLLKIDKVYSWLAIKTKLPINHFVQLESNIPYLSIILLALITFLWYGSLTKTLPSLALKFGIEATDKDNFSFGSYYHKLGNIFSYNFETAKSYQDINQYLMEYTDKLHKTRPYLWTEPKKNITTILNDTIFINTQELSPYPAISISLSNIVVSLFKIIRTTLNNIFLPLGIVFVLFIKNKKTISAEYVIISALLMFAIVTLTILPKGLDSYNIERLYLQLLMSANVLIIWALFKSLSIFNKSFISFLVCILFLGVYYFFYTGIAQSLVGGNRAVTLYNSGRDYYKNYTHTSEVHTARWLNPLIVNSFIFTDSPGKNRLIAYANGDPNKIITPILSTTLDHQYYVFLAYHNEEKNTVIATSIGMNINISTPKKNLTYNKNLIYSTGSTAIYK